VEQVSLSGGDSNYFDNLYLSLPTLLIEASGVETFPTDGVTLQIQPFGPSGSVVYWASLTLARYA
jgi:hypothetical protein